jgi:mannose-1-phosphate guanylyltransferase
LGIRFLHSKRSPIHPENGANQLKAIVLAGGFGTRLRPLSCTRPKLLFPIGNKPALDWTIEKLAKSGIKEVILAVNYMADAFVQHYRKSKQKLKVSFSEDIAASDKNSLYPRPLGTGGPIKNAEKIIGGKEPFLVLNGDVLTNIDYAELVKRHRANKKATATIALYRVEDPSRYGVAELTRDNRVIRFVEKPQPEKAPSNLINAGIYVLEPEIFDYIPSGKRVSIEREIFPKLAEEGKLFGYPFEGLWIDIGEPEDYLKANKLWLETEIKTNQIGKNVHVANQVKINTPSTIDKGTKIGEKSEIGPHVTMGENITIGKNVHIEDSIIFSGAIISNYSSIRGTIVGEAAIIGSKVKIESGCLIGDHTLIHDGLTLTQGVTVCPFKEVTENVLEPTSVM